MVPRLRAFPLGRGAAMTRETGNSDHATSQSDTGVKRRGLLRFGTLITAFTGVSAISAIGASSAEAGPGDKTPSTSYVPMSEKGAPSGVATLDIESKIPRALLPDLSATYATAASTPAWNPNTGYTAGARVVSPSGALVEAKVSISSGTAYSAANWTVVAPTALMPRYYDDGGNYTDRGALQVVARQVPAPTSLHHNFFSIVSGLGDNTNFIGVSGGMFQARDLPAVTPGTKGVLYGGQFVIAPAIDRDKVPFDDAVGISIENQGTARGTDALYFGHTRGDRVANPTGQDWGNIIQNDAAASNFIRSLGTHDVGISLGGATIATTAIRLGSAQSISWNHGTTGAVVHALRMTSANTLRLYEGGIDIRSDKSVYFQQKAVLANNTPLYGIRFGVTAEYELIKVTASDNVALFAARATILAGGGVVLQDVTTAPAVPVGGAVIYSEAGVTKIKSPSGTITTLAPA